MLTANQRQRIADPKLQAYLDRIAHNIVRSHYPEQDPDELLSVMNETVCQLAAKDPAFLDQTPGYITRKAAWAARDYCTYRGFAMMDYDGDGLENEFFASFALMRFDPGDGSVTQVHKLFTGAPGDPVCLSPQPNNAWAGDVDGDGRDELLYYQNGALRVDGRTMTGTHLRHVVCGALASCPSFGEHESASRLSS